MRELDEVDYNHIHLPDRYRCADFGLIQDEKVKSYIKTYLLNIRRMREEGNGFLLYGKNGVGKTMALSVILRAFRMHGQSCLYILAPDIAEAAIEGTIMEELGCKLWDYMRGVDVLLIDELGKEHDSKSGWSATKMENLFRSRYSNNLVTLVSTNLRPQRLRNKPSIDAMDKRYKHSMLNVIGSCMYVMQMDGVDLRQGKLPDLKKPDTDN